MVYRNIANKKELESSYVREEKLKNIKESMRIYQVLTENTPETMSEIGLPVK